jgi:transposase
MTCITIQTIRNNKYAYTSESHWDSTKKYAKNNKTKIGQFDLKTKKWIFTQEYLEILQESPTLMEKTRLKFPDADLSLTDNSNILRKKPIGRYPGDYLPVGKTYFTYNIADNIGLLKPLKESFPETWQKIFTIATFLLFENKAIMEADDFVEENLTLPVGTLASQRTSELFLKIQPEECNNFFRKWHAFITENEYIAFDSTSISSYSKENELVEFGKAKSNPDLKQINLCLLYGETSRLPIYQTVYSGSLNDVTVLLDILQEFESIVGTSDIRIVTDKGFCSEKNILGLIKKDIKFLTAIPFTNAITDSIISKYINSSELHETSSIISTAKDPIKGITKILPWFGSHKLYTHIVFDCSKALISELQFKDDLKMLKEMYLENKLPKKDIAIFDKFFIINDSVSKKSKKYILDNTEEIDNHLKHEGWLILISNYNNSTQEAHKVYVDKDCVEKAFREYKQNLEMDRIYTGNSKRFINKSFVAFIALILFSHINHVMSKNKMYRDYTMSKMFREINKMNVFLDIDNKYHLKSLTKKQKDILKIFDIAVPNRYIINYFIKTIIKS